MEHSLPEKYQMAEIYGTLGGDVFISRRESGVFEIPFLSSLTYLLSSKHNEMNLPGYYQSMLMYYVCMHVCIPYTVPERTKAHKFSSFEVV